MNIAWLRTLLSGRPHQVIGSTDDPYLLRWHLIPRNRFVNCYLHRFLRSDDDRALHDHPWWFVSLILSGGYVEVTESDQRRRHPGSIAFRRAETRHRVRLGQLPLSLERITAPSALLNSEQPCWTVVLTGRRRRDWGFWCAAPRDAINASFRGTGTPDPGDRFVPWQQWGPQGCGS